MPSTNLMDSLRGATGGAHRALEALPFARALSAGELPLESYVGYLRGLAVIHGVLENELPLEADARVGAVWDDDLRKLPLLQRDLAHFTAEAVRDIPAAVQVAQRTAETLRRRSKDMPVATLGYLYVLEGSTLGATVIGPWVRQAFRLEDGSGMAYLSGHGDPAEARWLDFSQRMNGLALSEAEQQAISDAGLEAFAGVHGVITELYPFDPDTLELTVAALNPEAGTHPITRDPREISAVRRAGERCLAEYPYFDWRYGERGRRFTDSDGAWLATLVEYPQERVDRQLDWLGTVLATRGMPRLLLQRHLELLHEELMSHVADSSSRYTKLLAAADRLADDRRRYISDEALARIQRRFEDAVGPDWNRRLPGTGAILVGAVVDEHAGVAGALASVREWMSDPVRFPPVWIEAVAHCIEATAGALVDPDGGG